MGTTCWLEEAQRGLRGGGGLHKTGRWPSQAGTLMPMLPWKEADLGGGAWAPPGEPGGVPNWPGSAGWTQRECVKTVDGPSCRLGPPGDRGQGAAK